MATFAGSIAKYPARASLWWYLAVIAAGAVALSHPDCFVDERPDLSLIDAVFTSTSAVCVTGLSVRSTGHDFSLLGQVVILVLIQMGGIGIMTVTTFATFGIGGMPNLRDRAVLTETLGATRGADLRWVLRNVILLSLACEFLGFIVLAIRNVVYLEPGQPIWTALWHALFHAIAAFCNAGFALFDDNMIGLADDPTSNITLMLLLVLGGIGFPVWLDVIHNLRGGPSGFFRRLSLHSKLMLLGTVVLVVFGTTAFLALEWQGVLADKPLTQKIMTATFQAITCRTAGFNTVEIGALSNASLFIMILLMMIGGGPCSTAGGVKVSTFFTLVLRGWATMRGWRKISLFGRTIHRDVIDRANTTALLFGVVAVIALTLLLVIEQRTMTHFESHGLFLEAMFEIVSALATAGLSMGLTASLTVPGKSIVILLMLMGRLGPISVVAALSRTSRERRIDYPYEEPLIG